MGDTDLTTRMCPQCGEALMLTVRLIEDATGDANADPNIKVTPYLERVEDCKACGWRQTL